MADATKNFAYSTVATAPSPAASGTSLVVQAGDGTKFPAVPFNATLWPVSSQPTTTNAEIVRVTGIATDTFTIVRAQESSSARTVVVGDQIAATITSKVLKDRIADDGWIEHDQTWVYASATSFTISGVDLTTVFTPGTKVSYNDGAVDYGTVSSSSFSTNTTVNLISNDDYSIANTTLTAPRYSRVGRPTGFPPLFQYTPTITGYSANPTSTAYNFITTGTQMLVSIVEATSGTSNATTKTYSAPITASTDTSGQWQYSAATTNLGVNTATPGLSRILNNTSTIDVFLDYAGGTWTASGSARVRSTALVFPFG